MVLPTLPAWDDEPTTLVAAQPAERLAVAEQLPAAPVGLRSGPPARKAEALIAPGW